MPSRAKTYNQSRNLTPKPDTRPSSSQRGYGARWRKVRLSWLKREPLCCLCKAKGVIILATVVDHVQPHRGDYQLMWDEGNYQSLCKRCHDTKTANEDGGFGRGSKAGKI